MRGLWALAGVTAVALLGLTIALVLRAGADRPATVAAPPGTPAPTAAAAPATPLQRLAFASDRAGNWEIYVMRADGSEQIRLTNDPLQDIAPVWSPDGRRIAFLQVERVTGEDFGELPFTLSVMPAPVAQVDAGREVPRPLFETQGLVNSLAWAPTGSKILLSVATDFRRNQGQLVVVDADTGEALTLADKAAFAARWSPDGSQIAYTGSRGAVPYVYVIDTDSGEETRAVRSISGHPAWSPDGTRLAFVLWTGRTTSYVALQAELGQRQADYLTSATVAGQWKQELQWAPDGEHLLYVGGYNDDGSDAELYLLGLEGDDPINLTAGFAPAVGWSEWSPDGDYIVFTGLKDERVTGEETAIELVEQVYVLEVASGQIKQLTSEGHNGMAVWRK